jgi:predicted RNA binding protein with dsRBD fold (UPF0201 family)
MTITSTSIEDAVRDGILLAGSNTNVIFNKPNAPRPSLPYTSIEYLTVSAEINDWDEFDIVENVNKHYGFREIVMTINCFGPNARNESQSIQGHLRNQTIRDTMRENIGISVLSFSAITDLTALIDSDYEERTSFDIIFNVNVEDGSTEDDTQFFDTITPVWSNQP